VAAYLIAGNEVTNPESMQKYVDAVGPTLAPYKAELLAPMPDQLVMGGTVVHREGDFKPSRVVIVKFPDMETAQAWYDSPEYQAVVGFRLDGSEGSLFFAEGP